MALGFTESKEDSNLYFKVEGGIPLMLLSYKHKLFLTGKQELIKDARRRLATEFEMKDLGMMHYFIGMEVWQNIPGTREACNRDTEQVQDDGLHGHNNTYGIEPEAIE